MVIPERDCKVDGIKWLLIVLVTIGHAIEPTLSNPTANKLYSLIYLFHMPLFIYISGYFASVKSKEKLANKGLLLLETFLVLMIPQFLYYKSFNVFLNPENSGWYLISLFSWYVMAYVLKYRNSLLSLGGNTILIISVLCAFIVFLLPLRQYGNLLSFQRTFMFLPFFMMGFLRKEKELSIIPKVSGKEKYVIVFLSVICFIFCIIYSGRILHVLEFNNANIWWMSSLYQQNLGMLLVLKVLVLVGSIITSLCVLLIVKMPTCICSLGSKTLAYYVMQGVFVHILASYFHSNFIQALILGLCVIIVTTILLRYVDSKFLTNPITSILKWNN